MEKLWFLLFILFIDWPFSLIVQLNTLAEDVWVADLRQHWIGQDSAAAGVAVIGLKDLDFCVFTGVVRILLYVSIAFTQLST